MHFFLKKTKTPIEINKYTATNPKYKKKKHYHREKAHEKKKTGNRSNGLAGKSFIQSQ